MLGKLGDHFNTGHCFTFVRAAALAGSLLPVPGYWYSAVFAVQHLTQHVLDFLHDLSRQGPGVVSFHGGSAETGSGGVHH